MFKHENIDPEMARKFIHLLDCCHNNWRPFGACTSFMGGITIRSTSIEILYVWQGGLASHGGVLGIIIAMLIWSKYVSKRSILWVLDRVVVPIGFCSSLNSFRKSNEF